MIEYFTLILLSGAVLYHTLHLTLISIAIISTLSSAFFFRKYLSKKGILFALLTILTAVLGALTVWLYDNTTPSAIFTQTTFSGVVKSVDRRLDKTIVVVHQSIWDVNIAVTTVSTVVLPGDNVAIQGRIEQPEDFITDTGRVFPYKEYLVSKGIVGVVSNAKISLVHHGALSLTRIATIIRFGIADIFSRYVSFPTDGLLAGMLVGYQGGIPQSTEDLFRTTGVLHVLVLSGENITLLIVFLSFFLRRVSFRLRIGITAIAVVLLVLVSGAGVAAVRAGIMGGISLLASVTKRTYVPLRALTLSVLCFFFINPETIYTDPGFHLSVLATLCMVLCIPKIEQLFHFLPERFNVREVVVLALFVPLFMLPYTMYFSGLMPIAAPFANTMMSVMVSVCMLGGALLCCISFVPFLAGFVGLLLSLLGKGLTAVLEILTVLPQLNTPPLAWWGVVLSYGVFFAVLFCTEIRQLHADLQNKLLPRSSSSVPESH